MRAPRVTIATVERAHVAYWLFGAVWPLVSMKSFERVTGNKRDEWLVRTVALLMLSVVATLETMRSDRREERSMRVLGATSAGALGSVALIGPLVGRISPVYLADALIDSLLAVLWLRAPRDGTASAAVETMERDSEHQGTGPQGGDGAGGDGGGRPQRGFPSTIGDVKDETHDPEPRRPADR